MTALVEKLDTSNANRARAIGASIIGNALEWYDFTVYAFLAAVIGKHFFPSTDDTIVLLSTFAVFGVGFLARPLGGVLIWFFRRQKVRA